MAEKGFFKSLFSSKNKETDKELEEQKKLEEEKKNPLIQGESINPKNGIKKHSLVMESMASGIEKHYFWVLRFLREQPNHGLGFDAIEKVKDVTDASVTSSFHGHVGAKLSAIQQQASQYLATIGQMVKTIFPIVREIRITDERLEHYEKSLKGDESAEIALKSIWVEMVEQGMQNPNSVYGLGTKVGFVTVPDLFFKINPGSSSKVEKAHKSMENLGVNAKVRDVVAKKLFQYYVWKEKTHAELKSARLFKIKYLRQHYNAIKLYMNWVRPYLRTIKQLQLKGDYSDADLVSAFETAKVELELLAYMKKGYKVYHPCLLVRFNYVTMPELTYNPQGQKQPSHLGRTEITIEPYVATDEHIKAYKANKDEEDLELISTVDATMMALKDDLKKYLEEAGEVFEKEEKKEMEREGIIAPFLSIFDALGEMFSFLKIPKREKKMGELSGRAVLEERKKAATNASLMAWTLYDIFKKANKLMVP